MKKIYLVVMLVLTISLFSLDHGLIAGSEFGYNFKDTLIVNDITIDQDESFYIQLTSGYRIGQLRIIGTYTNTLVQDKIDNYIPLQDDYRIDINYLFFDVLTIGLFHSCNHPVSSQSDAREDYSNSYQRAIYIRYYKEF